MQSLVLILQEPPYGTEKAYNALRYARALLAAGVQTRIYLLADGVFVAKRGQTPPKGFYNLEHMLHGVIAQGALVHV